MTASLQGRVVDQNGIPVQGAVVTSGAATTSTDINGLFSFSGISMSSRFGYVTAAKQETLFHGLAQHHYRQCKRFELCEYLRLIPQNVSGTFPAPVGGKVAVATGDTATFAASSVVEASSGTPYTGMVTVYATRLSESYRPEFYIVIHARRSAGDWLRRV